MHQILTYLKPGALLLVAAIIAGAIVNFLSPLGVTSVISYNVLLTPGGIVGFIVTATLLGFIAKKIQGIL